MLLGQGVMINWSDVAPEHRAAYYEWHSREHMVGRVAIAGFQRGRRYIAVNAQRDFFNFYEVDDLAVLTGPDYLAKANAPSPLTQRTTPFVKNSVRGISRVKKSLGIGTGGYALTLRFDPANDAADKLDRYLGEAFARLAAIPEIVGVHLIVADPSASTIVPVERMGRPTIVPNWIIVLEGISIAALDSACDAHLAQETLRTHGCAGAVDRETYSLQIMVSKSRTA
jgi:hypothetical protein